MSPFALALPLFATTDGAVNVAVVQGINDNVSQTRDANGDLDRHPATFTGIDGTGRLIFTNRGTDTQSFTLRLRTQAYVGLDAPTTIPPSGTFSLGYIAGFTTGPRSSLALSASANLTSISSARTGDGNLLLTLDPTANTTSVANYSGSLAYSYVLGQRWSITETLGTLVTTTLSSDPLQAAGGVVLERTGLDGIVPSAITTLAHDLGKRDVGTLGVTYRYIYSPYSLDIGTSPPGIGGPQGIHQVVPSIALAHSFSETVTATTSAGLSMSTVPRFDDHHGIVVFPVGSETLSVTGRRWTVRGLASVSYGTVSARLGAGPSYSLSGSIAGTPLEGRNFRKVYLIASAQANHSDVPTTTATGTSGTTGLEVAGVGAELRYGLTKWLGLYTGYDARATSSFQPNEPLFFRQVFFIGLSGYFTTDGALPPIETAQSPYTPG